VIFGFIAGLSRVQPISFALPPVGNHIGEEEATHVHIEGGGGEWRWFAHALQHLSPAQKFAIDLADLLHDLAEPAVVGERFGDLPLRILGHVIHLRVPSRVADGEVILGAMARTTGTFASWLAARFVSFDEGAAE
jgi:hypothetical protein